MTNLTDRKWRKLKYHTIRKGVKFQIIKECSPTVNQDKGTIEFLYISIFLQCRQQRLTWGRAKKINQNYPEWDMNLGPFDYYANAVLTELIQHLFASLNFMAFIKSSSIDSGNDQSPKYEVVHETKLILEISCPTHICLAQSVDH